jgi:guanosine-3',5'-bis(diphosphate) 3'-pyrophosphohydrolase
MNDLLPTETVELPQEQLIRRLCATLDTYLEPAQIDDVCRAYELAVSAHQGQFRLSGEPYVCHPVSVAMILADIHMDAKGIMAAMLHDVIEDTAISKEQLKDEFGEEVAELVDGVSKLTQLEPKSRAEAQAQNMRKMVLAMVKDLRVIMVKLADRLHNMRTLGAMSTKRKRRIARETLDIYAPIANRLGMNQIRLELEELGFNALYPMRYRVLENALKKARGNRKELILLIEKAIRERLQEAGIRCTVNGREKHLYSIYQKMRNKKIPLRDVLDVYAFRIITEHVDGCYRALGFVHNLYKPVPGCFKDYIAVPKANGYQSIHTVLIGPYGLPIEIQIRTEIMHRMAESGIAAHWLNRAEKEQVADSQARALEWLRDLLEIQKNAGDSLEFLDNLKVDLFQKEVYVFTPKGDVVKLPRGATIVDFAYAVHTDIGNTCVSARINRRLAPMQTALENGQTVEIITAPWARPNPLWLNYVVTAKARAAIRNHLRNFKKQEAIKLGGRLLDKELNALGFDLEDLSKTRIDELLRVLKVPSLDALLEDIGLGNRLPFLVAKRLCQDEVKSGIKQDDVEKGSFSPLIIKGTEGMVVNLAKCCRPIPGDPIIGVFSPGKGIVVHLSECRNVTGLKKQTNWLDVEWDSEVIGEYPVEIRVELKNKVGTLAKVASTISKMGANIENVQITNQDDEISIDQITLLVKDRTHLAGIIRELKSLPVIEKISRVKSELRKKA